MADRIMTQHPDPNKQGTNIERAKYDAVRTAILAAIEDHGGDITFQSLTSAIEEKLAGRFDGSVGWYVTTVKLDLEARGEIERVPGSSPQRLRLVE